MPKLRVGSSREEPTTNLSFRLPVRLIERVDVHAAREIRNRANMVTVLLMEALSAREAREAPGVSVAANLQHLLPVEETKPVRMMRGSPVDLARRAKLAQTKS